MRDEHTHNTRRPVCLSSCLLFVWRVRVSVTSTAADGHTVGPERPEYDLIVKRQCEQHKSDLFESDLRPL